MLFVGKLKKNEVTNVRTQKRNKPTVSDEMVVFAVFNQLQNPEEEEWEAFKKEIAVEMTVSQDIQVTKTLTKNEYFTSWY